jgi:predicted AlkP superfamily pyrophosphatase or phosphodiesterase
LDRYADLYTGGFKRLAEQGYSYTQATHRHGITETAPGHTTLSTGVFPSRHGVVSNSWTEVGSGGRNESVYAVRDTAATIVGHPMLAGRSPANLLRDGLANWITAANPEARIASISTKDRAAIPLAARAQGHVYWITPREGRFITSDYYRDSYPDWVEEFNEGVMTPLFADSIWTSDLTPEQAERSRPDWSPYEGDGEHSEFPHVAALELLEDTSEEYGIWFRETPKWDQATLGLTLRAIDELELGQRDVTDFLAVSFSQVDYVGHKFGPYSREQLDNMLRLDALVGTLLDRLDETVGEGRWTLAFSSDHGVLELPEYRMEQGLPGRRLSIEELQLFFDELNVALRSSSDPDEIRTNIESTANGKDFVERVYRRGPNLGGERPDSMAELFANSYSEGRYTGILGRLGFDILFTEGTLSDGLPRRTTHGTPYWYDRHVPLVFMGAGVGVGSSDEGVYSVDVAPTLAHLAGIPIPDGLDGNVLIR